MEFFRHSLTSVLRLGSRGPAIFWEERDEYLPPERYQAHRRPQTHSPLGEAEAEAGEAGSQTRVPNPHALNHELGDNSFLPFIPERKTKYNYTFYTPHMPLVQLWSERWQGKARVTELLGNTIK